MQGGHARKTTSMSNLAKDTNEILNAYLQLQDEDVKLRSGVVKGDGARQGWVTEAAQELILSFRGWSLLPRAAYKLHRHFNSIPIPLTPLYHAVAKQ